MAGIKWVQPDARLMDITKEILEQNGQIVEINYRLIDALFSRIVVVQPPDTKEAAKEGG